jgi:hypothetical protein
LKAMDAVEYRADMLRAYEDLVKEVFDVDCLLFLYSYYYRKKRSTKRNAEKPAHYYAEKREKREKVVW